jgi:riboflavin synthase
VYTGLVSHSGRVAEMITTADGARMRIETALAAEMHEGDSIAVNGVCLTATALTPDTFDADVMHETLRRSTLGELDSEDQVNLELSLAVDQRLDGHFVQGHIDGVGTVSAVQADGFAKVVTVEAEQPLLRYVAEKGSIAVDGVSLTVAGVGSNDFKISLIPETQTRTTLGRVVGGSRVNLEVDVLAKYVERLMQTAPEV